MAAARVPKAHRGRVVFWGLAAAVILRVILATLTASILEIIGLMFAGGILLLWVSWRLYRDLAAIQGRNRGRRSRGGSRSADRRKHRDRHRRYSGPSRRAIAQIVIADLSMSLDNVLAVAGAAMDHVWVLAIGLVLSIALMGIAASLIANLLQRHPWISYAGSDHRALCGAAHDLVRRLGDHARGKVGRRIRAALRLRVHHSNGSPGQARVMTKSLAASPHPQQHRRRIVALLEARECRGPRDRHPRWRGFRGRVRRDLSPAQPRSNRPDRSVHIRCEREKAVARDAGQRAGRRCRRVSSAHGPRRAHRARKPSSRRRVERGCAPCAAQADIRAG